MMIDILVMAAAALQAAPDDSGLRRTAVPLASLVIPDEIAPAVLPYMGCLLARNGVAVRGQVDPRPNGIGKGGDCSPLRARAVKDADALLKRKGGRSREHRAALIEATLVSMERFANAGIVPPAQGRADDPN